MAVEEGMTELDFMKKMQNMNFVNADVKGLFAHSDAIRKDGAMRLCGEFLGGSWKDIAEENFDITVHQ